MKIIATVEELCPPHLMFELKIPDLRVPIAKIVCPIIDRCTSARRIFFLIKNQYTAGVKAFLANANLESTNHDGYPLLHAAVLSGNLEIIELLLQGYCKIMLVDKNGRTVLEYAEFLLTQEADEDNKKRIKQIIGLIKAYALPHANPDQRNGEDARIQLMKHLHLF